MTDVRQMELLDLYAEAIRLEVEQPPDGVCRYWSIVEELNRRGAPLEIPPELRGLHKSIRAGAS